MNYDGLDIADNAIGNRRTKGTDRLVQNMCVINIMEKSFLEHKMNIIPTVK